jgi:hypothetical protein
MKHTRQYVRLVRLVRLAALRQLHRVQPKENAFANFIDGVNLLSVTRAAKLCALC